MKAELGFSVRQASVGSRSRQARCFVVLIAIGLLVQHSSAYAHLIDLKTPTQSINTATAICDSVSQIPKSDCEALVTLFNATNGSGWTDKTGWTVTSTPCSWFGVVCNFGRVDELNLTGNQLSGTIPSAIGALTELGSINFSNNQLTGSLPAELNNLRRLHSFDVTGNHLSGSIPLSGSSALHNLYLAVNLFSGNLDWIVTLPELQNLHLYRNRFTGSIPTTIGTLTQLRQIIWHFNAIEGEIPPSLTQLTQLNALSLGYNRLLLSNPNVYAFVQAQNDDGATKQTVAPTGVQITNVNSTTLQLSWQPIVYTQNQGYYEISYSASPNSGYAILAATTDKSVSNRVITGLAAGTYYFRIRTRTLPHGEQENDLYSSYTSPVSSTIGGVQSGNLLVDKFTSKQVAQAGQSIAFTVVITAVGNGMAVAVTDTLPDGLEVVAGSLSIGANYDSSTRQVRYNANLSPNGTVQFSYNAVIGPGVPPGSMLNNRVIADGGGFLVEATTSIAVPNDAFGQTLFLVYANADNDLSADIAPLLNSIELAASNSAVKTFVLLDGPGGDDTYVYKPQLDNNLSCPSLLNPTCNGRYRLGYDIFQWTDNTASPYSLAEFINSGIRAYPNAQRVILSIVGHGDGWSPDLLLGQPSRAGGGGRGKPGGLLADSNPYSSLATRDLGNALRWGIEGTGKRINMLFLDACLMSTAETAYELRDSTDLLLASQSWSWTRYPYDALVRSIQSAKNMRQIGVEWIDTQAAELSVSEYANPFTFSLIDLARIQPVVQAVDALGAALSATLPGGKSAIQSAYAQTEGFDSNLNGGITSGDNLRDLDQFADRIKQHISQPDVISAANAIRAALNDAVIYESHNGGVPSDYSNQLWQWGELGGLSLYMPLHSDDWRRRYYTGTQLQLTNDTRWNEFLRAFWEAQTPPNDPVCIASGSCPNIPGPMQLAPIALDARGGLTSVLVDWQLTQPITDFARYTIDRATTVGGTYQTISSTVLAQYADRDANLNPGTTYCYQVSAIDRSGQVRAISNVACTIYGRLGLWIPDQVITEINNPEWMAVNVDNGDGFCSSTLGVVIDYDPNAAQSNGELQHTSYANGYRFSAISSAGQVRVSLPPNGGPCLPLSGAGSLFRFAMSAKPGTTTTPVRFNTSSDGTRIFVGGQELITASNRLLLRDGSLNQTTQFIRGDVDGDSLITIADIQMSLSIAVGATTPTALQRAACDVSGDGLCTAADATLIDCRWRAQDWSRCDASITQRTSQGLSTQANSGAPISVCMAPPSHAKSNETITIPITVSRAIALHGADVTFVYDPALMEYVGMTASNAAVSAENANNPGLLRMSLSLGSTAVNSPLFVTLRFKMKSDAVAETHVAGLKLSDVSGLDVTTTGPKNAILFTCDTSTMTYLPLVSR